MMVKKMKLGITSYTYRWAVGGDKRFGDSMTIERPLKPFELVQKVADLGLEVVQICENVDLNLADKELEKLGKTADDLDIKLELGAAGLDMHVLKKCAKMAELTHASLVRVYPTEKEPVPRIVKRIRDFLPVLQTKDLMLAVENSSLWLYASQELAELFEKVDSPFFGACVDVVNSTGLLEKPLETVKILAPYAMCLHLKDYRIQRREVSGFMIFGVPLGKGMLDAKAVLNTLRQTGREPDILLEQFMGKKETVQETIAEEDKWVKEAIRYVRSIL
jgi:sugar phosphate isomerase/epimerase